MSQAQGLGDNAADKRSCGRAAQQQAALARMKEGKANAPERSDAAQAGPAAQGPGAQQPPTAAQLERLRQLGCGYEPVNRAEAGSLIKTYVKL